MKKRIAKKILNQNSIHWDWYYNDNGLWSIYPKNPSRFFKACKRLHIKPYYDMEWLKLIKDFRRKMTKHQREILLDKQ